MQPDQLLVACPKCHAWPMAVHAGKKPWPSGAPLVRFTCAKCGNREERLSGEQKVRRLKRSPTLSDGLSPLSYNERIP